MTHKYNDIMINEILLTPALLEEHCSRGTWVGLNDAEEQEDESQERPLEQPLMKLNARG